MTVLEVRKGTNRNAPWCVHITAGPSADLQVGWGHRLRREAQAWADAHEAEPWAHAVGDLATACAGEALLAVVPCQVLAMELRRVAKLEAELAAARRVLLHVDGSAAAMARAHVELAREAQVGLPDEPEPPSPYVVVVGGERVGGYFTRMEADARAEQLGGEVHRYGDRTGVYHPVAP